MDQCYLPFLYVVSQKMISHFYVLGFGMEHWVLYNTCGTGAVTLKWNMGILLLTVQNRAQVHCKPTGDFVPFSPRRVLPGFVNPRIGSKPTRFSI
jgi:hypothetical protein